MGNGATKKEKNSKSYLLQTCEEHDGSINCMEVSEDGSVLATGSDDAHIRLWSTKTDLIECIAVLEGHEDYITSLLIEDNFLLSSSADKTIRKWDMSTSECVLVFLGHESTVNRMVCTGDFVFSVSYDKKARCWDFDTGECVRIFSGHKNNVNSILFIPADKENLNDALKFVQAHAAKKNLAMKGNRLPPITKGTMNNAHEESDEEDNIYSRDLIITGSLDSTAKSWSIETGECVQTFKSHTAAITCLATDPLGKLLFTGSADHSIKSWEIMTGQLLKTFAGHQTTVISLLAHRKLLYSTSSDHTARCWVMEFGDCTRIYKEHTHSVSTIIENNGLVYTGCGDSQARCFDSKSGALRRTFKGHTGAVNCLRVVEGRLFTGSFDGTLRIWDLSELSADRGNGADKEKNSKKNDPQGDQIEMSPQPRSQKMVIENEKSNYNSKGPGKFSNSMDQRSEADSGFDDKDYFERNQRRKAPREEIV